MGFFSHVVVVVVVVVVAAEAAAGGGGGVTGRFMSIRSNAAMSN